MPQCFLLSTSSEISNITLAVYGGGDDNNSLQFTDIRLLQSEPYYQLVFDFPCGNATNITIHYGDCFIPYKALGYPEYLHPFSCITENVPYDSNYSFKYAAVDVINDEFSTSRRLMEYAYPPHVGWFEDYGVVFTPYNIGFCLDYSESISGGSDFYRDYLYFYDGKATIDIESPTGGQVLTFVDWYIFIHQFDSMIRFRNDAGDSPPVHIARLDVAYDDIDNKVVTVPLLQRYIKSKHYVSISKYVSCVDGTHEQAIYFGSPRSDRRLRIYDKRMEQLGREDDIPWVRYEFQLRDVNALSFYLNLCDQKGDWAKCYFGVLSDYVTFTNKSRLSVGHHTERLEAVKWWRELVGDVLKLKQLYLPGRAYSLKSIQDYFNRQCLSAAKAVYLCELIKHKGDSSAFLNMIMSADLNKQQEAAVDSYIKEFKYVDNGYDT